MSYGISVVTSAARVANLCEEQRLVEPVIRQFHVAHAGTRVIKQVSGVIKGVWRQKEPVLQIAYCRSLQSSQQRCPEPPLGIRVVVVPAEIDWMANRRRTETGKLFLLNAYPIFRELHGLSHAKFVADVRFVAQGDASNGGVVIGPGLVLDPGRAEGPDKVWNMRRPVFKALTPNEEVIRDWCEDLEAELLAIVQEVEVPVARRPVVETNQIRAH